MKSILITDTEKRDQYSDRVVPHEGPKYPYGTCITIGKELMSKLEMDELPAVGAKFMVLAVAEVVEASKEDGEKKFELQITDLDMKAKEKEHKDNIDRAESIYS